MQKNYEIKKAKYKDQYGLKGNDHIHPFVFSNEFEVHKTTFNDISTYCYNDLKVLSLVGKAILKAEIDKLELYEKTLTEAKEQKVEKTMDLISDVTVSKSRRNNKIISDKIEP